MSDTIDPESTPTDTVAYNWELEEIWRHELRDTPMERTEPPLYCHPDPQIQEFVRKELADREAELAELRRKAALWDREVALWDRTVAWAAKTVGFDSLHAPDPEASLTIREATQLVREASGTWPGGRHL